MRRDGYQPDHGTLDPKDPPGGRSAVQPVVRCSSGLCDHHRDVARHAKTCVFCGDEARAARLVDAVRAVRIQTQYLNPGEEDLGELFDALEEYDADPDLYRRPEGYKRLSEVAALRKENAWLRKQLSQFTGAA